MNRTHLIHYLPLIGVFIVSFIAMITYQHDTALQRGVVVAAATAYLVWGIVHHRIHHDLNLEIFLEYLFMAIIGVILVFTVL